MITLYLFFPLSVCVCVRVCGFVCITLLTNIFISSCSFFIHCQCSWHQIQQTTPPHTHNHQQVYFLLALNTRLICYFTQGYLTQSVSWTVQIHWEIMISQRKWIYYYFPRKKWDHWDIHLFVFTTISSIPRQSMLVLVSIVPCCVGWF